MESVITFLNITGKSFTDFSATMLIQSSVLIVLLLLLNVFLRKKVRVVFLYGIWMLLLVKLVLPTTLWSPLGVGNWIGDKVPGIITEKAASTAKQIISVVQRIKPVSKTIPYGLKITDLSSFDTSPGYVNVGSAEITARSSPAAVSLSWHAFAFIGWLAVVTAMVLLLIRRMIFVRILLAQSQKPNDAMVDIFERCRKQMGINKPISLEVSPVAVSPSVCGLFRPRILIPQNLPRKLKAEDLRSVLLHELAHIKRGDMWVSLMQTILQIAYFYNLLLWVANVIIRKVREQAVDEMVLVAMGEQAEDYPETLLNISRMTFGRPNLSMRLIGIIESKKALERRIMIMLSRPVPKSSKLGICGLITIVVIGTVILPMGYNPIERPALAASVDDDLSVERIIIPGHCVGDFTFNMTKDDILEAIGRPKNIFFADRSYTLDNLPRKYFMHYGDLSFHIVDDKVKGITVLSPSYKFPNRIKVGDSEEKVKKAFGEDFHIEKHSVKDFLYYKDENIMFEIHKQDRTVMEINVSPSPASGFYKKADIPPTTYINEKGRLVDKVDYPFVDDPKIIGGWKSVDFVREIKDFDPSNKNWRGKIWLNHLIFEEGGTMPGRGGTWTRGLVLDDDTASKYILKEIDGSSYMFYEWKSGDYTIRYMKPFYYVLKKVSLEEVKQEPMYGEKADIPETSYINDEGRVVDKIDWPFVDDPQLIGTWESVDFVGEMEEFEPDSKQWKGTELYLKGLIFKPDGKTFKPWWTWTKGLIFHSGDKTASKYTIKDIEGSTYMFYEWKSGDYTIRHMKPSYYVLKKVSSDTEGPLDEVWISKREEEKIVDEKAHIPETSYINEKGRIVDKIDYPFVNDQQLIGTWESVDFVGEMEDFKPDSKQWGGDLYLKGLIFKPNGKTFKPWWTWTKGLIFHSGDKTASKYTIKDIEGSTYMFYEWKSGDYTIRHRKPSYYVLKKVSSETSGPLDKSWISGKEDEKILDEKADIPATSYINEKGHIVDKIDYPFVNDPQVIGTWESVDFVDEIKQFKVGQKQWKDRGGELFLNEMIFGKNGRLTCKNDKVPNGYSRTWTKGLVIYDNDTKTASKYIIKEIDDLTYIFYEWKSGDYTFRHRKPSYYVLKKVSS